MAKNPWNRQSAPEKRQRTKPQGNKSGKDWDSPSGSNSNEKSEDRRFRSMAFWTVVCVALLIFFVKWVPKYHPRPPLVVFTVARYQAPLPPNSFAEEDARGFQRLDKPNKILICKRVAAGSGDSWNEELLKGLRKSRPGGPDKNVVMVYISAHGLIDKAGNPCLFIPGKSKKDDSDTWVRVSDLLTGLFPKNDDRDYCRDDVLKLVILDANRLDYSPSLGLLHNAFAAGLADAVSKAGVERLYVLNSTSPGQVAWSDPLLRGSVFAHCLQRGLAGAADRARSADRDGKVTLRELEDYVIAKVFNWVSVVRQEDQVPMLVPDPSDEDLAIPLVDAAKESVETAVCSLIEYPDGTSVTAAEAAEKENEQIWQTIQGFWRRHGKLADSTPSPYLRHPLAWARLESRLLRSEQLADAGQSYKEELRQLQTEIGRQLESFESSLEEDNLVTFSLPLARRFEKKSSDEEREAAEAAFKALVEGIDASKTEQPDEVKTSEKPANPVAENAPAESAGTDDAAKAPDSSPTPEAVPPSPETAAPSSDGAALTSPPDYLSQANVAWRNFLASPLVDSAARARVLGAMTRPNQADVSEILFLRMVDAYLDPKVWTKGSDILKSVLAARKVAEEAAAPDDERTFYGIRWLVEDGDRTRRKAEDELFAWDGSVQLDDNSELAKPPAGDYGKAVKYAELLRRAFAARDRALATLPFLCRWNKLMPPENTGRKSEEDRLQQVGLVVQETRVIAELLDKSVRIEKGQSAQLASLVSDIETTASQLEDILDKLERNFDSVQRNVRDAGDDARKLRDMTRILATARLTGKDRVSFIDDQRRLHGGQAKNANRDLVSVELEHPEVASAPLPTLDRLPILGLLLPILPKHDLLGAEPDRRVTSTELGEIGERIRAHLHRTSVEVDECRKDARKLASSNQPYQEVRMPLAKADRSVRTISCYLAGGDWLVPSDEPAARLRRFDLSQMLIWHAGRALDDFWADPPDRATEGADTWFEVAATHYRNSATTLVAQGFAPSGPPGMSRLESLLTERKEAARQTFQLKAENLWFDRETDKDEPLNIVHEPHRHLPAGTAALYLQYWGGNTLSVKSRDHGLVRRVAVPVSSSGEGVDLLLPIDPSMDSKQVTTKIVYRGHCREDGFEISVADSVETEWQRPEDSPTTVVVRGDSKRRVPVVFVLDCSYSMRLRTGVTESVVEGDTSTKPRFDVLRETFLDFLEDLEDNRFEVGIVVYGHRYGYAGDTRAYEGLKWNSAWENLPPSDEPDPIETFLRTDPKWEQFLRGDRHPALDVQIIRDLKTFRQEQRGDIEKWFGALTPLGITPLYLAILEAMTQLRQKSGPRYVVAITDGKNNQEFPTGFDVATTDSNDVLRELKKINGTGDSPNRLTVNLIGFDTSEDDNLGFEEFGKTLEERGFGGFRKTGDSGGLRTKLDDSLQFVKYTVNSTRISGSPRTPAKPLGAKYTKLKPGNYEVAVDGLRHALRTQVAVYGGDSLRLFVENQRESNPRLVHRRYGSDDLDEDQLYPGCFVRRIPVEDHAPEDPKETAIYVGVHAPLMESGRAENREVFHVSVQNDEETRFSHRPTEVWMEVTPRVDAPGSAQTESPYILWDAEFVPQRPVPVLRFRANNWPKAATGANVFLFCKFAKTKADGSTHRVGGLQQESLQLDGALFEVHTEAPGSPTESEFPRHIVVIGRGEKVEDWKVEISPMPDMIRHRFVRDKKTVAHKFYYRRLEGAPEDCQLQFTSRKNLERGAVLLGKPLVVPAD